MNFKNVQIIPLALFQERALSVAENLRLNNEITISRSIVCTDIDCVECKKHRQEASDGEKEEKGEKKRLNCVARADSCVIALNSAQ